MRDFGFRQVAWAILLAGATVCPRALPAQAADAGDAVLARSVRAHMEFLASDALDGRGSGTRDEFVAATYLGARLRSYGLEPMGDAGGFVQQVDMERLQATAPPELNAAGLTFRHGAQMLVLDAGRPAASGPLRHVASGGRPVAGAVLLMPADADPEKARGVDGAAIMLWRAGAAEKDRWARRAAGALMIGPVRFSGLASSGTSAAQEPVRILLEAASYDAVSQLPDGTRVSFSARTQPVLMHTWNALGLLRGSDRQAGRQVILLSAHLDHLGRGEGAGRIYPGADDDASGTIAVLELAKDLARGPRPRRSVVFALFGSEETGSLGARYFLDKPTVPIPDFIANLEFEMIGRGDPAVAPHTLWLTGWERSDLGPALAAHGARLVGDPHPRENFFMRSDNITLARRGVVAQTISSFGLHPQYHQPDDDIAHIDFEHMTRSIQSLFGPVRWLANADFVPHWRPGGRP